MKKSGFKRFCPVGLGLVFFGSGEPNQPEPLYIYNFFFHRNPAHLHSSPASPPPTLSSLLPSLFHEKTLAFSSSNRRRLHPHLPATANSSHLPSIATHREIYHLLHQSPICSKASSTKGLRRLRLLCQRPPPPRSKLPSRPKLPQEDLLCQGLSRQGHCRQGHHHRRSDLLLWSPDLVLLLWIWALLPWIWVLLLWICSGFHAPPPSPPRTAVLANSGEPSVTSDQRKGGTFLKIFVSSLRFQDENRENRNDGL